MRISDHVVLRYMERKLGVDVDAVRREIEGTVDTRGTRQIVAFVGDVSWRVRADGMIYCVRGDMVTTCCHQKAAGSFPRKRRDSGRSRPEGRHVRFGSGKRTGRKRNDAAEWGFAR